MMKFRLLFVLALSLSLATAAFAQDDIDGGTLVYGEETTVEAEDAVTVTFTFDGAEGDVINIIVDSDNDDDTNLVLMDEDEEEVATDDDGGEGLNPGLRRFVLPSSGTYTLVIAGYAESELTDDLEVLIEQTEILSLNEGAQTVELSDEIASDVMVFETEEDTVYIVTVTLEDATDSTIYLSILEEDEFYANTSVNFSGVQVISFVFEADESGPAQVGTDWYGFGEEVSVTVEIEALQ